MLPLFITEFGGYFLTVGGSLTLVFWTIFPKSFRFQTRREAVRGGLLILGMAVLLGGLGLLAGSILEARLMTRFF